VNRVPCVSGQPWAPWSHQKRNSGNWTRAKRVVVTEPQNQCSQIKQEIGGPIESTCEILKHFLISLSLLCPSQLRVSQPLLWLSNNNIRKTLKIKIHKINGNSTKKYRRRNQWSWELPEWNCVGTSMFVMANWIKRS